MKTTLKDLKKKFDKGGQYRYVLIVCDTKMPYSIAKTYSDALEGIKDSIESDCPHLEIVDLIYWGGRK